jgi:Leucine-rich repeat (LRR) protein
LILSANDIKTLQALTPLYALKGLEEIDLSENPVAELPNYRETLFEK